MADSSKRPRDAHAGLSARPHILHTGRDAAARHDALAAVRGSLEKAGLNLAHFDELRRRSSVELQAALARFRAAADERAPAMQQVVARSAEHWLRANGVRSALGPASGVYSVSTADLILGTSGIDSFSEQIAPWANTAQIVIDRQTGDYDSFDETAEFLFSWQNPTGQDVLCTVTGLLGVTATAVVTADSYWFPLPPFSRIDAKAELGISVVDANGEVTTPPLQSTQAQKVFSLETDGGWTYGTIAGQDIFRGYVLQYLGVVLPAAGKFELTLSCEITWVALDGGGQFIAAGGGRQLSGFGLIISTEPAIV